MSDIKLYIQERVFNKETKCKFRIIFYGMQ